MKKERRPLAPQPSRDALTRKTWWVSIPNASSPMVRDALVLLLLQTLNRIIQEKVDQDCINAVRLVRLFGIVVALASVLVVGLPSFGNALLTGRFDFWVTFLDFTLNELHAPDARTAEFDLPV